MGLKKNDLNDMVYDIVTIDDYASKMGEDKNIVTIGFQVASKEAANDLCDFIEKGNDYILDADVSAGELDNNEYLVFVEIKRNKQIYENIIDLLNDIMKLSGIEEFKFRYYKQFRSHVVNMENLERLIPSDPEEYGIQTKDNNDNYDHFFKDSTVESVYMKGDFIIFEKSYNKKIVFEVIDYGSPEYIKPILDGSFEIMESYPVINYLTKYLGDYNISKYGDIITMENQTNVLALKEIKIT